MKLKGKPSNIIMMILGVIVMGIGVATLKLTAFGPDPCSAMNYGMAALFGLSLGTYQLLFNIILFVIIFFIDKSLLGLGSFGNMILVGYSADFTSWVILKLFHVETLTSLSSRIIVMIPALIIFTIAAAVYMNCDLGTSPYDAAAFLIHKKLCKATGRKISFRILRIIFDGAIALFAWLIKGEVGLVTFLMVPLLGPAVEAVGRIMNKIFNTEKSKDE